MIKHIAFIGSRNAQSTPSQTTIRLWEQQGCRRGGRLSLIICCQPEAGLCVAQDTESKLGIKDASKLY